MFQDYVFYGVDNKVFYAFRAAHLSSLVQSARESHGLSEGRAILLGQALLSSMLLAAVLNKEERINLRVHCGSDFTIGTETTVDGETRGYIECNETSEVVKNIDSGIPFSGELFVRTLRSQHGKNSLFEGRTVCPQGDIQDAINEHLNSSFQMNTKVRLSCWIDEKDGFCRAFGSIYQHLPDIPEEVSQRLAEHLEKQPSMRALFESNSDPDILIKNLIPDEMRALKSINPKWQCSCSQEKVEHALKLLPQGELEDIISKNEKVDTKCNYCGKHYSVDPERVMEIYASQMTSPAEKIDEKLN